MPYFSKICIILLVYSYCCINMFMLVTVVELLILAYNITSLYICWTLYYQTKSAK